ncbi:hypothetical protein QR680_002181 [Steinernema hermaphroditum]|uniref:Palmitoyltransferase n=1 Tax=Steinernema hermaphroditum TaxID=289476 RepID=A0AA39H2J3_9BILA|nr:hypothetical protein QR680_002181 [Steinernema hermaphroditum]
MLRRFRDSMCRLIFRIASHCDVRRNPKLYGLLDSFIRRGCGKILVVLVHFLVGFIFLVEYGIVLPYEAVVRPKWFIYGLGILGIYLVVNILFNYTKAYSTPPGSPPKSDVHPQCSRCLSHKPRGVHHCSMCNTCVVRMDHHCIWINQCVGANNHRYFLQFLFFLFSGCCVIVMASFTTFANNFLWAADNTVWCRVVDNLPWKEFICQDGGEIVTNFIFFSYSLAFLVMIMVGGLFFWNCLLISIGNTYIDYLQRGCPPYGLCCQDLPPFNDVLLNWRIFLGLRRNRSFFFHVLLPSNHPTEHNEENHPLNEVSVV